MLSKNLIFEQFYNKPKGFKSNLIKTKKVFNKLKFDYTNGKFPLLKIYEKNHKLNFSKKIIKKFSKFKNIIIVGMGGSSLGAKSIFSFFKRKIKKNIFFFDDLDEELHFEFNKIKNKKNSCFIIISKSGNTLETISNLNFLPSKIIGKKNLVFICEFADNILFNFAKKIGAEVIEHNKTVGGRYSVLSEVGMFPAHLMGLNTAKFKNLKKFFINKNISNILIENVAHIFSLYKSGFKNSIILNYHSQLNNLGLWYQQLVAESLGKKKKGIMPIISKAPKDHHSLAQLYLDGPRDKFFTFFVSDGFKKIKILQKYLPYKMNYIKNDDLNYLVKSQSNATKKVFKKIKIPYRYFKFKKNGEEELGTIFTFFTLETILLAKMLKVNPFNQPSVEKIKKETKKILG